MMIPTVFQRVIFFTLVIMVLCSATGGCSKSIDSDSKTPVDTAGGRVTIKLATTTSLDNSGLLAHILPDFTEETGIEVDIIAVGTGKALELGRAGDVDVLLVHAPDAEREFISEGYGLDRYYVAQNEFVIVGPFADPAGVGESSGIVDAFGKIHDTEAVFISRGDQSGTHKRELIIWDEAGLDPEGAWYIEVGQGMGAVLTMASELEAYALSDIGTFFSMEDHLDLVIVHSCDELLENIYSVIPLNAELFPNLKHEQVAVLIEWLTGPVCGDLINRYEVNGHRLFDVR